MGELFFVVEYSISLVFFYKKTSKKAYSRVWNSSTGGSSSTGGNICQI